MVCHYLLFRDCVKCCFRCDESEISLSKTISDCYRGQTAGNCLFILVQVLHMVVSVAVKMR